MVLTARFPRAFLTLWIVTFLGYLSFQLLTASLPLYAVTLGADDAAVGLLAGVIALISLLSRPWVGWWLDRGGARWGMVVGGGFYALSALGILASHSVVALASFRTFTGLAIALSSTTSLVLTVALAPEHRRGEALSLLSLANSIGQGVGPVTGIAVAERAGYPGLFATCALLGAMAGGLALNLRIGNSVHATRPRDRRVIHSGVLVPGLILAALSLSFGVTFGLLAVHASRRSLANPGLAFVTVAGGQILAQTLLRRVSDRFGRRATIAPGLVLVAAGMGIMAGAAGLWLVLGGLLFGIGLGTAVPTIYALASDLVPSDERGRAMGTLGVFSKSASARARSAAEPSGGSLDWKRRSPSPEASRSQPLSYNGGPCPYHRVPYSLIGHRLEINNAPCGARNCGRSPEHRDLIPTRYRPAVVRLRSAKPVRIFS